MYRRQKTLLAALIVTTRSQRTLLATLIVSTRNLPSRLEKWSTWSNEATKHVPSVLQDQSDVALGICMLARLVPRGNFNSTTERYA